MTEPYGTFTDKDFHAYLKKLGISREEGTEWFFIEPNAARGDFIDFTQNHGVVSEEDADAVIPYKLRDEQAKAVQKTHGVFYRTGGGRISLERKTTFRKDALCLRPVHK